MIVLQMFLLGLETTFPDENKHSSRKKRRLEISLKMAADYQPRGIRAYELFTWCRFKWSEWSASSKWNHSPPTLTAPNTVVQRIALNLVPFCGDHVFQTNDRSC